jgi:hypothetical protein
MTPRSGGEAAKFGERYEGRWTVRRLLDVLSGRALSMVVEDEAALAEGAEFTLRRSGGKVEVHQVKRQLGSRATWTQNRLAKEGVLDAMALHADADQEFRFISMTPTPWLQALADKARRSDDLEGFIRVQLDGDQVRRDFYGLADGTSFAISSSTGELGDALRWRVDRGLRSSWSSEQMFSRLRAIHLTQVVLGSCRRRATTIRAPTASCWRGSRTITRASITWSGCAGRTGSAARVV